MLLLVIETIYCFLLLVNIATIRLNCGDGVSLDDGKKCVLKYRLQNHIKQIIL